MRVVYSEQVRNFLKSYEESLHKYGISKDRIKQKVTDFRAFLHEQIKYIDYLDICKVEDLGQQYNKSGKLILTNLKETSYKDKSEYQWRISLFRESKNLIRIYRIIGHKAVKSNKKQLYESIMRAVSKVVKKHLNSI